MNKYLADIATFPSDVRTSWRVDGARGVMQEISERTLRRVARTVRFDVYERDITNVPHVDAPSGLQIRLLRAAELSALSALLTHRRLAQIGHAIADRIVFAGFRGDRVVAYSSWSPFFDSAFDFAPLTLPVNAIFHGFVHVERAERHRGTARALFSAGERHCFHLGFERCWYLMRSTNVRGAAEARGRWGGRARHIARLDYSKLLFRTTRALSLIDHP